MGGHYVLSEHTHFFNASKTRIGKKRRKPERERNQVPWEERTPAKHPIVAIIEARDRE